MIRYLRVRIHQASTRHGIAPDEIEHVFRNAILVADLDVDADPPKVLMVGPDHAGRPIELVGLELADAELLIIHAMPLRPTFRDLLP